MSCLPFGGGALGYSHNFDTGSAATAAAVVRCPAILSGGKARRISIAGEKAAC